MNIRNIYKKYSTKRNIQKFSKYLELSNESIYETGFSIDLRCPIDRVYLKIGKDSLINAHFIFEKDTGKVEIGERCHIGNSTFISIDQIIIGDDVEIAWNCLFYDHNSHSILWDERKNDTLQELSDLKKSGNPIKNKDWDVVKHAPIKIENKVWVGVNCTILKGVTVGEGAVIAAGSVVTKDVEPWSVVAGNPARVIKKINSYS